LGRLFGRIKAVKQIVLALTKSIVPVMNAFCIMLVAICICEYAHRCDMSKIDATQDETQELSMKIDSIAKKLKTKS
jgi:hypothetical protein